VITLCDPAGKGWQRLPIALLPQHANGRAGSIDPACTVEPKVTEMLQPFVQAR
jgi:hypothetical protein